jgi:hypothetical protein
MEAGMKRFLTAVAMVMALGAALGATPALAQEDKAAEVGNVKYSKQTTINFEDDTIEGDLKRPDGEYVEARRKVDHSNLIRIREDWRDKVMQSSSDL